MVKYSCLLKIFSTIIAVSIFQHAFSQVHVDSLKDVGIGTNDPEGAKMKIQTTDESKALHIYNGSPDTTIKFGIYNELTASGSGAKMGIRNEVMQNSSASSYLFGQHNNMLPHGSGEVRALSNYIWGQGIGDKYGIHNTTLHNESATGELHGIYNYYRNSGSNVTYGIYNIGSFTNPIQDKVTGIVNLISHSSKIMNAHIFGIDTRITPADSTSAHYIYGMRTIIGEAGNHRKLGVYSEVSKSRSSNNKWVSGFNTDVTSKGGGGGAFGTLSRVVIDSIDTGYGVFGSVEANGESGNAYGIYGTVSMENDVTGYGVYGSTNAEGDSGEAYGVYGTTVVDSLVTGFGVYGLGDSAGGSGEIYGVKGEAIADNLTVGYGVYGEVSGTNSANSFAGFFDGPTYADGMYVGSDRELKEDIEGFTSGLETIQQLRPVSYHFKKELKNKPRELQYGFIAQEVEEILPELIKNVTVPGEVLYETEIEEIEKNENEHRQVAKRVALERKPSTSRKAINYNALIPILVKAMQEQHRIIEFQQTEIQAQKVVVSDLIKRVNDLEKFISKND